MQFDFIVNLLTNRVSELEMCMHSPWAYNLKLFISDAQFVIVSKSDRIVYGGLKKLLHYVKYIHVHDCFGKF